MMRIEMIWLALGASDLRGDIDALLGQVVRGFAQGAQVHHAYVFANRRAYRLKVLVYDGVGMWLCTRRLQAPLSFELQLLLGLAQAARPEPPYTIAPAARSAPISLVGLRRSLVSTAFHQNVDKRKSMDSLARLGINHSDTLWYREDLQRRMASEDAISCQCFGGT